ncbi:MAG: hypothetical protein DMD91_03300 [Candidatus Rokuibacteriota bacterium]|nr:MAG: hypothetical protein DMD91_03300 [Candidatus Rokubacteria bacterium]
MSLSRPARLAAGCVGIAAAILPTLSTPAQMAVIPRVIHIENLKCAELLALSSERQDRVLIDFDGYFNGMSSQTTWDASVEGEMIERAVGYCKADPSQGLLSAFTKATSR